jgi:trans-aconitate 2-methyltransferase
VTTATSTWDPQQYAQFRAERSKPFYDLAALVKTQPGMRVVDLGCGDGRLTAWLHQYLTARETLGVDTSATMLAAAAQQAGEGLHFERADLVTFTAQRPFDLVFANASLHWAPHHEQLLPRLCALLTPGGQIAVQIPAMADHPSHTLADSLAEEEPFARALGSGARVVNPVLRPARYAELLWHSRCAQQTVRLNVYPHVLPGYEAVVEWVRGAYLTSYEARLGSVLFKQFLQEYTRRLAVAIPQRPYLYAYARILLWGQMPL